jgi:hypothetical protein
VTAAEVEQITREAANPFDLLLHGGDASVLELGAGDLSFAWALVECYLTRLQRQHRELILHCIDRLRPGSRLGGPLHADPVLLNKLQKTSPSGLQFRFIGNQDMFELDKTEGLPACYAIVACSAPATPAFAYEPTRLSSTVIEQHLRETKGKYRTVPMEDEEALEVRHQGRSLLFPPWKFEIRGPLALLELLARRGRLAVLSVIDAEVFWELMSQLVDDPSVRPRDVILTPSTVADLFGPLCAKLSLLPIGSRLVLSDIASLRSSLPSVLDEPGSPYRFRYVEIRRGAVFSGIPASRTAHLFNHMKEEEPPWFMVLVPDDRN